MNSIIFLCIEVSLLKLVSTLRFLINGGGHNSRGGRKIFENIINGGLIKRGSQNFEKMSKSLKITIP